MKTEIYHLIILDESGSMSCITRQTIMGCNETLNTIRSAQAEYADSQDHYVSIYLFQSNNQMPSHYIVKNSPISVVNNINEDLYHPWGGTPLYDAVGSTLVDLKMHTRGKKLAIGNVTIITDGMENSSHEYTRGQVAKMIDELKEMGWSFNFIGANIDVESAARSINIDNSMAFEQNDEGTREMFECERKSRMNWLRRAHRVLSDEALAADVEKMRTNLREAATDYFSEEDDV